ncbi:MAG: hypothetical protein OQJ87_10910 [Rhodospirillales bacterium]|nr:hypothetical protein [Rhodospirillales bacterium]MCW8951252.1 hypothetical protein [Rhodospirillales bacterium]MCW8970843.1 hypothetical protein [Rhodospirillales bacterium]MCW9003216.1 hypothetical protein [Rhodospirillales bacterium]MCW9040244.1 hypothetical protein [Rhodospirillales bacterium]
MEERKHIFDNPRNVKRLIRGFFVACVAVLALDLVFHRHAVHPWESLFGFHALYGFGACVALVLIAKELRRILMRGEDYYDDK